MPCQRASRPGAVGDEPAVDGEEAIGRRSGEISRHDGAGRREHPSIQMRCMARENAHVPWSGLSVRTSGILDDHAMRRLTAQGELCLAVDKAATAQELAVDIGRDERSPHSIYTLRFVCVVRSVV